PEADRSEYGAAHPRRARRGARERPDVEPRARCRRCKMTVDQRPNPDELLAQVSTDEAKAKRGKLKVFFGMAAGVGKTYAMLEEARARAAEGLDVVVGYAEPHIRTETEALLLGMEILPYKVIDYRGTKLKELDLDAALARTP